MSEEQPAVETLSRDECVRLLASVPFGRIIYTVAALPAVQPVNFTIRHDTIVVRTASESKLAAATRNSVIAFQADQIDVATRAGWSVTVVGRCSEVVDPVEVAELALTGPQAWGRPASDRFIVIGIEQVTGRWLHSPVARVL